MKGKIILGFLSIVVVFVLIVGIGLATGYNKLVDYEVNIDAYYAQIEVRLQERHDKIGEIVAAVEGLQEHAETIYNAITAARQAYADAITSGDMDALIAADAAEAIALTDVLVAVEDNPLITATAGYMALIDECSSMESALAVARRDFNEAVADYNAAIRKFPTVLYAGVVGFTGPKEYWKMNDGAEEVPTIDFTN
ncbi:MAG: LemA family protein [Candidatus Izemoplasmatales bacterium]